jgi:hypothetical protein
LPIVDKLDGLQSLIECLMSQAQWQQRLRQAPCRSEVEHPIDTASPKSADVLMCTRRRQSEIAPDVHSLSPSTRLQGRHDYVASASDSANTSDETSITRSLQNTTQTQRYTLTTTRPQCPDTVRHDTQPSPLKTQHHTPKRGQPQEESPKPPASLYSVLLAADHQHITVQEISRTPASPACRASNLETDGSQHGTA